MNLTQKISQMTPKGADLDATDLIEVSTIVGGSYVTKSITGQELIDAIPLPPTGLTIGTTPIASGTNGRVLFQGTGNVLQQSANLFWDNTNGRLGIGTSSPAQFLDILSSGNSFIGVKSTGTTTETGIVINNNLYYASLQVFGSLFSNTALRNTSLFATQSGITSMAFATLGAANIAFKTNSNGTNNERLTIFGSTGNVGINTTTDAGFKLDVNGTARVSGTARIESSLTALSSATIGGTTLAANAIFQVNGSGKYVNYNSSFSSGSFLTYQAYGTWDAIGADSPAGTILAFGGYRASQWTGMTFHSNGSERMRIFSTGNIGINTTTDAGFRLDVNGTARVQGNVTFGSTSTTGTATIQGSNIVELILSDTLNGRSVRLYKNAGSGYIIENNSGNQMSYGYASNYWMSWRNSTKSIAIASTGSEPTPDATSIFDLQSTTKGFLPPRMTTTQKNAIASPAAGLVVYDTTLAKLCVYTTTWETITSL
jgi:hypothetical protein